MQRTKIKCPICGKEISKSNYSKHERRHANNPESFEGGRKTKLLPHEGLNCQFCGKLCKNKNSLVQHELRCISNQNRINVVVNNFNSIGRKAWNKGLNKSNSSSVLKQSESLTEYYRDNNGFFLGHKHSDSTKVKISDSRKRYLALHPDKTPYLLNHSSEISYPEQYFLDLFNKEGLDLSFHMQVGIYQLDFYNKDKMIDIEIDGEQHYVDNRILESDIRRTDYLMSLGWTIYRIRWSEYKKKTLVEKKLVIDEIRRLLI